MTDSDRAIGYAQIPLRTVPYVGDPPPEEPKEPEPTIGQETAQYFGVLANGAVVAMVAVAVLAAAYFGLLLL